MDRKETVCSVTLGEDKFVALAARRKGASFEVLGCGTAASKGYSRGMITDIGEAAGALEGAVRQAEVMAGTKVDGSAVAGLSGEHIQGVDRNAHVKIQGGAVTEADIDLALDTLQAFPLQPGQEILHVLEQEFVIDGQAGIRHPLGMRGSLLEADAHVVTAATNAAANHRSALEKASAAPRKLMSSALATGVAVTTEDEREMGVAALDWGGGTCDCITFRRGVPRRILSLPLGGADIDRDVAKIFHIPMASAERIKREIGSAEQVQVSEDEKVTVDASDSDRKVEIEPHVLSMTIQPRVEEMLEKIREALGPKLDKEALPAGVVLTGGTARLRGVVALANEVLHVPVRMGRPRYSGVNADLVEGPEFAASLGLLELLASQEGHTEEPRRAPGLGEWLARLFGGGSAEPKQQGNA